LQLEKEKLEISKLIEENKKIEQQNLQNQLKLDKEKLELKNKELEEMKKSLNQLNIKSNISNYKSINSDQLIKVKFVNKCKSSVEIMWHDFSGKLISYGHLGSNCEKGMNT